ncbi:MAG: S41 family peptidase [Phycisphaerales bacterium]|nr:S41 family peptidase [Phycisphaerales bacterium]
MWSPRVRKANSMRNQTFILITTLLLGCTAALAAQDVALKFDFEDNEIGGVPDNWVVPEASAAGFNVKVAEGDAAEGEQYIQLHSELHPRRSPFGNVMQSEDAAPFRGKMIRFRAAVRADVFGYNSAQLWLRVDRPNKQMGFFDNMRDRPITSNKWKYYEIVGLVDEDAVSINFGLMLSRKGNADLDDVSIEILDADALPEDEPPRPLKGRALKNIVAFTRLLGYVRYFHPSDEAAEANWETFAIEGIREIESAESAKTLAEKLEKRFQPIAPTVRVFRTGRQPVTPAELERPNKKGKLRIRRWEHQGLGLGGNLPTPYKSKRTRKRVIDKLPKGYPDPADPFIANLGDGVSCMVPLSLYADKRGTLPGKKTVDKNSENEDPLPVVPLYSVKDRATRLADIALAWNVFQHFYPYFDVVETDWDAALRNALKKAATDDDERVFVNTLREMIAQLHDGHGNIRHSSNLFNASLPINWTWVKNRLVVTNVAEDLEDAPEAGDVVVEIDGQPVAERYAELKRLISGATPQSVRWRALKELSDGKNGEEVKLKLKGKDGRTRTVTLTRTVREQPLLEPRPEKIEEIEPGIYYVDIERVSDSDFSQVLSDLETAKGIIFDFRGYPSKIGPEIWLSRISRKHMTSPQWHIPVIFRPNREEMTFTRGGEWNISPKAPYLKAEKAFIIDGRAISYAESCMGIVEHYKLGEIVGEPSAGTNGNINPFRLPGGYNVVWTGMKVLKHDGSQHHGIGIRPTIPVTRTIEGIAAGRDELLERAVKAVSS